MPAPTQALVDVELLRMSPTIARRARGAMCESPYPLLGELSERVLTFVWEISGSAFATVTSARGPASARPGIEHLPEPSDLLWI